MPILFHKQVAPTELGGNWDQYLLTGCAYGAFHNFYNRSKIRYKALLIHFDVSLKQYKASLIHYDTPLIHYVELLIHFVESLIHCDASVIHYVEPLIHYKASVIHYDEVNSLILLLLQPELILNILKKVDIK